MAKFKAVPPRKSVSPKSRVALVLPSDTTDLATRNLSAVPTEVAVATAAPEAEAPASPIGPAVLSSGTPTADTTPSTASEPDEKVIPMDKTIKTAEEFVSFGQANFEALVKSSQIWTAGWQDLGKAFAATAQANLDEAMTSFKALSGVKSLQEAFELQGTYAKAAAERTMTETGKLADASAKLAEQAFAPLTERFNVAVERFGKGF